MPGTQLQPNELPPPPEERPVCRIETLRWADFRFPVEDQPEEITPGRQRRLNHARQSLESLEREFEGHRHEATIEVLQDLLSALRLDLDEHTEELFPPDGRLHTPKFGLAPVQISKP